MLSGKLAAPLWVPAWTVLVCSGAGNNQSELLRVRNFRGMSARTANGSLDVIFSARGVVCSSKGYMSWLCWPVPTRHAQALKKWYLALPFIEHLTRRWHSKLWFQWDLFINNPVFTAFIVTQRTEWFFHLPHVISYWNLQSDWKLFKTNLS